MSIHLYIYAVPYPCNVISYLYIILTYSIVCSFFHSNLCSLKFTKKNSSSEALNSEQSEQSQAELQQLQVDPNPNV